MSVAKQAAWEPLSQAKKAAKAAKVAEREANAAFLCARKEGQANQERFLAAQRQRDLAMERPKLGVAFAEAFTACCRCGLCLQKRGQSLQEGCSVRLALPSLVSAVRQSLAGKEGVVTSVRRDCGQMPYEAAFGSTKPRWFKAHELVACGPLQEPFPEKLTRGSLVLANMRGEACHGVVLSDPDHPMIAFGVEPLTLRLVGGEVAAAIPSGCKILSRFGKPPEIGKMMEIGTKVRRKHLVETEEECNSEAGVVVGYCLAGAMLVRFGSANNGIAAAQVALHDLECEADWQDLVLHQCIQKRQALEANLAQTKIAHLEALSCLKLKQEEQEPLQKEYNNKCERLEEATKFAESVDLVTLVKFSTNIRPAVWRDLSGHVTYSWAVQIGSTAPGKRPLVASIDDVLPLARAITKASHKILQGKKHILGVQSELLQTLQQRPEEGGYALALGAREANKIAARGKLMTKKPDPLHSFSLLKAALGAKRGVLLDDEVQEFLEGPETGLVRLKEVEVPNSLNIQLRPYQHVGFKWLVSNAANGFGSILADDMGLGKTVQVLAFLLHRKEIGRLTSPALVVVPTTLLLNWQEEASKLAPDLRVYVYHGRSRKLLAGATRERLNTPAKVVPVRRRLRFKQPCPAFDATPAKSTPAKSTVAPGSARGGEAPTQTPVKSRKRAFQAQTTPCKFVEMTSDIFLTSYATLREDEEKLKQQVFSCMVLDESQNIKRHESKTTQAVKRVADRVGAVRVALSGTPVENSLADLHSQFEYILPGYLASSRAQFFRDFEQPIAQSAQKLAEQPMHTQVDDAEETSALEQQRSLQRMIKPFLLRREKSDPNVAPDLPDKLEKRYVVNLTEQQRALYKAVEKKLLSSLSDDKFTRGQQIFTAAHAFRQVCNHPATLKQDHRPSNYHSIVNASRNDAEASAKCEVALEILGSIFERKEKVLIFSNYLEALVMLSEQIHAKFSCKVLKIDGSMDTAARQAAVSSFQEDDSYPVMLLTLKTGGVGLNLTRASHVVHFDRCFNPAIECQATDRTHRIGQLQKVCVHTLIAKDTFEERIDRILRNKAILAKMVVAANENWIADYSDDDLKNLFCLSGHTDALAPKKQKTENSEASLMAAGKKDTSQD